MKHIQAFFHGKKCNAINTHLYCKNTEIYSMAIFRGQNGTESCTAGVEIPCSRVAMLRGTGGAACGSFAVLPS